MPLPEGYLPREGDVLILHAKVRFDVDPGESDVHLSLDGRYKSITTVLPIDQIDGVLTRHFNPGERVEWLNNRELIGEVIAVADGQVWVKIDEQSPAPLKYQTFPANELVLIQKPPIALPPALDDDIKF